MSHFVTSTASRRGNKSRRVGTTYIASSNSTAGHPEEKRIHKALNADKHKQKQDAIIGSSNTTGLVIQGSHDIETPGVDYPEEGLEAEFPVTYSGKGVLSFKTPVRIDAIQGDVHVNGKLIADNVDENGGGGGGGGSVTDPLTLGTINATTLLTTPQLSSAAGTLAIGSATSGTEAINVTTQNGAIDISTGTGAIDIDSGNRLTLASTGRLEALSKLHADAGLEVTGSIITDGFTSSGIVTAGTDAIVQGSLSVPQISAGVSGIINIGSTTSGTNEVHVETQDGPIILSSAGTGSIDLNTTLGAISVSAEDTLVAESYTGTFLKGRGTAPITLSTDTGPININSGGGLALSSTGRLETDSHFNADAGLAVTGGTTTDTLDVSGTLTVTDIDVINDVTSANVFAGDTISGGTITAGGTVSGANVTATDTVTGSEFAGSKTTGDIDLFRFGPNLTGGYNLFRGTTANNLIGPSSGPGQMFLRAFDGRLALKSDGPSGYIEMHSAHGKIDIDSKGAGNLSLLASGTGDILLNASGTGEVRSATQHNFSNGINVTGTSTVADVTATGTVQSTEFDFPEADTDDRDLFSNKISGNVSILKNTAGDISIGPTSVLQTGTGTTIRSYNRPMTVGCLGGSGSIRFLTSNGNHFTMTSLGDVTSNMRDVTLDSSVTGGHLNLRATGTGNTIISHEEHNFLNGIDVTGGTVTDTLNVSGVSTVAGLSAGGTVSASNFLTLGNVTSTNVNASGTVTGENVTATGTVTGTEFAGSKTVGNADLFRLGPNLTGGYTLFKDTTANNFIGPSSGVGNLYLRAFDGRLFLSSDGTSGQIQVHSAHGDIEIDSKGTGDLSLLASGSGNILLDASGTGELRSVTEHNFSNGINVTGTASVATISTQQINATNGTGAIDLGTGVGSNDIQITTDNDINLLGGSDVKILVNDNIDIQSLGTGNINLLTTTNGNIALQTGGTGELRSVTEHNFSNGVRFSPTESVFNHYDTGEWTPEWVNATGTSLLNYQSGGQTGTWTRIGNTMLIHCRTVITTVKGSANSSDVLRMKLPNNINCVGPPDHRFTGTIGYNSSLNATDSYAQGVYVLEGEHMIYVSIAKFGNPTRRNATVADVGSSAAIYFDLHYRIA